MTRTRFRTNHFDGGLPDPLAGIVFTRGIKKGRTKLSCLLIENEQPLFQLFGSGLDRGAGLQHLLTELLIVQRMILVEFIGGEKRLQLLHLDL